MIPIMRKALIFLLGVCSFVCSIISYGQEIKVSDPVLELKDNTIHITYDILNSSPSEEFTVELQITDSNGTQIHAAALTGDVGDMVPGGDNKHIAWDLEVDKIEMNASIHVNIYVKAVPPPEPVVVEPVEEKKQEEIVQKEEPAKTIKQFNYANKRHIPFVVLLGESEMNANTFTLKNMKTGHQESLSFDERLKALQ